MNNTQIIQQGQGSAYRRLLKNAERAEKRGDAAAAARFREAALFLKNMRPSVWS